MTKPIRTYEDLLEEKARLKLLLTTQKAIVRQDINQLKQELAPVRSAIAVLGKFATKDNRSWVITTLSDTIIDMVFKKIVLSRAGFITKLVVPFFIKNFSSHVISDNKNKIISKLASWFGKKNYNGKEHVSKEKEQLTDEEED